MADNGPTGMTAMIVLQKLALDRLKGAGDAPEAADGMSRENLAALLERDLQGRRRVETLQGLLDLLCDGADTRAAVAKVLDPVSWEIFEGIMACLDESMPPSSSSTLGHAASSPSPLGKGGNGSSTNKCKNNADGSNSGNDGIPLEVSKAAEVAALSERLVLELAEIFSPKELHVMALAHLPAYSGDRAVRAVLTALRRSTQRMPPLQRAKFLEAAIPPVIEATKRLAANAVSADPGQARGNDSPAERSSDDEEQDSSSSCEGNHARGMDVQQPPAAEDNPPRAVYEAAASAAETAVEFVGPLLEQACMEGALALGSAAAASAAAAADPGKKSGESERNAYPGPGNAYASDLAVAAYTGFALSALEISVETSASATAPAPAATAVAAVSPAEALERDNSVFVMKLAAAEERLVGLVMSSPTVDLPLILLHVYRLSFHDRVRARGKGGGDEQSEVSAPGSGCGGLAGLAELAVAGSSPWTLQGVSSLAYLVACKPRLRDRWLPLVWSRRMERRLFLPYAEVMMRSSSKRVARKGLELACFVGERLGAFPDEAGDFAFEWEEEGGEIDGAWVGGGDEDLIEEEHKGARRVSSKGRLRQRRTFDPYHFDLASFLQVLVDVMVSCPLPILRARGHAAMLAFLTAVGEGSRFRVLKRLIKRCPWPNATGLLLDAFRREVDRALRSQPEEEQASLTAASQGRGSYGSNSDGYLPSMTESGADSCGAGERKEAGPESLSTLDDAAEMSAAGVTAEASPPRSVDGWRVDSKEASPFASPLAGDLVCEQLRRACRKGPPASMLMDMDSRTGGLMLARYAHALDSAGSGGNVRGTGARWGRLMLREPKRLLDNQLLVEGFLGQLRGAAITAASAGPVHFRLFILEDAAQQCLEELRR